MIGRFLVFSALLLSASVGEAADRPSALSSPMINRAIYRDGEVRRLGGQFGDWTVTCEEIVSLKQRYCSLRSVAMRTDRTQGTTVDLSTGDNGRPAALLHLPLGVSVVYGVDVETIDPVTLFRRASKSDPVASRRLGIASCTPSECLAVWSPNPGEIEALTRGGDIRLTLCMPGPEQLAFATDLKARSCEIKSAEVLSAAGFKDAITASTL